MIASCCFFALFGALQRRTAASTVGSTLFSLPGSEFGSAAMAEVVVARPETIFIGTASRFAKGVEHVWQYKLTFVGAQRMYVCMEPPSTTHAGDLMFYHGRSGGWQTNGLWHMKGGLFPMRRAKQELEKACCSLSYFGLVLGGWSA